MGSAKSRRLGPAARLRVAIAMIVIAPALFPASSALAGPRLRACSGLQLKVPPTIAKHVFQARANCATAHRIIRSYIAAVSTVTSRTSFHQGVCYPRHAYGECRFVSHGRHWACNHFNINQHRGLVRCVQTSTAPASRRPRVSFNIGY